MDGPSIQHNACVSQITNDQVSGFSQEAQKFNQMFKEEGPASVGTDLDKGTYMQIFFSFDIGSEASRNKLRCDKELVIYIIVFAVCRSCFVEEVPGALC